MQIFQDFSVTPEYGMLHQGSKVLLQKWLRQLQVQLQKQAQMAQQAQAFAQMQMGWGGGPSNGQGGGEPAGDGMTMTNQGPNQLVDESLPGAKGQIQ